MKDPLGIIFKFRIKNLESPWRKSIGLDHWSNDLDPAFKPGFLRNLVINSHFCLNTV